MSTDEFGEKLVEHNCAKDKIVVVGHSLGGAVASMFSYCANLKTECGECRPLMSGYKVQQLYTIGSPSVVPWGESYHLENGESLDGCFQGLRIYKDKDPVPRAHNFAFMGAKAKNKWGSSDHSEPGHAKQIALMVTARGTKAIQYACSDANAAKPRGVRKIFSTEMLANHKAGSYVEATESIDTKQFEERN